MKRHVAIIPLLLVALLFARSAFALNPSSLQIQKTIPQQQFQIQPCILTGTCPTAVPTHTPTPTNTPVPPTNTPTPGPSNTPTPTQEAAKSSVSSESTPAVLGTTAEPTPNATATPEAVVNGTPTLTPAPKQPGLSKLETGLIGGVILLLLVILFLAWPKIKAMLHKKSSTQ